MLDWYRGIVVCMIASASLLPGFMQVICNSIYPLGLAYPAGQSDGERLSATATITQRRPRIGTFTGLVEVFLFVSGRVSRLSSQRVRDSLYSTVRSYWPFRLLCVSDTSSRAILGYVRTMAASNFASMARVEMDWLAVGVKR